MARSGNYHIRYEGERALWPTTGRRLWTVLLAVLLVAYPFVAGEYFVHLANQALIVVVGAVGLQLLTGQTGLISLAHAAFIAVGGYAVGVVSVQTDLSLLAGLGAAVLSAVALSLVVGLPSLRLESLYLAIATMAFHFALLFTVTRFELTGGNFGLRLDQTELFGWTVNTRREFYVVLVVTAVGAVLIATNLRRSRTGRAWGAVRDRDLAAQAMGVNLARFKLYAFAVSGAYGAIAGGLSTAYLGTTGPDHYTFELAVQYLAIVIVGGLTSLPGTVMSAVLLSLMPELLRLATGWLQGPLPALADNLLLLQSGLYGVVLVVVLLVQPEGLNGVWVRVKRWWLNYPYSYR
ncbi:Branched-chain amino acid transport system permease protein LivM [Euzebya pacifica]|uniref:Branched-chain amino acid transport system permease protein LivM n=1 Tax=Euzebya pacifica TaxID=1608957 RepID=A0A346XWW8_9ACTN|nr:Branched-chain amino acid transport system permease protein LivM [Euzebya pacifica]